MEEHYPTTHDSGRSLPNSNAFEGILNWREKKIAPPKATSIHSHWTRHPENIFLKIEPGERIAIVGRTGSGKSTLILSLLGFTHIESGKIVYDGVDLKSIPRRRLRQSISTIPQEPQLFQGTIGSNLDPSGTIPEAELQNALRICQSLLQSTDQLEKLEITCADSSVNSAFTERLSLSTMVKSKGENFSHGQRQVVSLCRVIIRYSKLILLDKATSSMDLVPTPVCSKRSVKSSYVQATIMDYDRVVVMGSGTILEVGSPKYLLAKKSVFYDMVIHSEEKHALSDYLGLEMSFVFYSTTPNFVFYSNQHVYQ
ncbi:hypothetical protein MY4824_001419 [Beauveria thailandica]